AARPRRGAPPRHGLPLRLRCGLDARTRRPARRRGRGGSWRPGRSARRRGSGAGRDAPLGGQRLQGARHGMPGEGVRRGPPPCRGRLGSGVPGVVDRPPRRRPGQPCGPGAGRRSPQAARRLRPRRREPAAWPEHRVPAPGRRQKRRGRRGERGRQGPARRRDARTGRHARRLRFRQACRLRNPRPPGRARPPRTVPGPPPQLRRGRKL
ncbi:MAG: Ribonuclease HII, partial [uncultured Rubrobacteraceae bacterium]